MNFYDSNLGVEVRDDELYHYGRSKKDGAPIGSGRPRGSGGGVSIYKKKDGTLTSIGEKRAQALEKRYEKVTGHEVFKTGNNIKAKSLRQVRAEKRAQAKKEKLESKSKNTNKNTQNVKEMIDAMSNEELKAATARLKAKNDYLREYATLNPPVKIEDKPIKKFVKDYTAQLGKSVSKKAADYTAQWLESTLRDALELEQPQQDNKHTEHAGKPKALKNAAPKKNDLNKIVIDSFAESLEKPADKHGKKNKKNKKKGK